LNVFESFQKWKCISFTLFPFSAQLAQPISLSLLFLFPSRGPKPHRRPVTFYFPSAQPVPAFSSRSHRQAGPACQGRPPPVAEWDSVESGRHTPRCGLLGPHAKGRCPPLYKQRCAPREPYRDTAAVAALANPSTAAIDELELGVAAVPPFPPLHVNFKPPRSFAPR